MTVWAVVAKACLLATAQTYPPLPNTVTSFGAVTSDGYLYVFGGHKGERHVYTAEMVSGEFHRLKLGKHDAWEKLPDAQPGQGQPLVAHKGYVYRTGGMAAHNHTGEKQNLYSISLAQRYNIRKSRWEDIPSLPAPRSSHDAAVIGNKFYLAGGWQLGGGTNKPVWPDHGLVLDLAARGATWRKFPQPFRRRALAVAALDNKLYCIGGMDSDNEPTLAVDIYDTVSGEWSKGPALPNGKHKGFSCAAVTQGGRVYANAFQGDLLRLSTDGQTWEVVGRLEHPRMAHRLVTAGAEKVIALGGEDGEDKTPSLEVFEPTSVPVDR
ncbi:MAG TPA: hypothetical protein VHH73_06300 [Verrucomicrobiae bacterium]|nr:hypothetical protein [Verrucomicrobiae bacterium]